MNPIHAQAPLSGRGAELYGGRFNAKGVPALYTSLSIMTAIREANQVGALQPTTLVSYEAEIGRVFDARDPDALAGFDMNVEVLAANTWRDEMRSDGSSRTQRFSRRLAEEGHHGLLVPSFALGATASDLNLVLWAWSESGPSRLRLVDDENRLSSRS